MGTSMALQKQFILCTLSLLFFIISLSAQQNYFQTGQSADIILHPYADASTAKGLYGPSRAMSDGTRLFVSDSRNNRVLIWNSVPTNNYEPADIVVGQMNFESNYSSNGPSGMCWPMGVYSDGQHLFVSDAGNYRVLIWNSIPTTNGQPADLVLGQPDFETVGDPHYTIGKTDKTTGWPWDVHFDGERLYVVCTDEGRVLIWNELPTQNYQAADIVLGQKDFYSWPDYEPTQWSLGTPRSICVEDNKVIVGDYSGRRILIWNTIPTTNGQNADVVLLQNSFESWDPINYHIYDAGHYGIWMKNGKIFLAGGRYVTIWNSIPTSNGQMYDMRIGYGETQSAGLGVCFDGQRLITCGECSRVLIYNSLPTNQNTLADVVVGQPDFKTDLTLSKKGFGNVGGIVSTGKELIVAGSARINIFKNYPTRDGDEADLILSQYDFSEATFNDHGAFGPISDVGQMWTDGVSLYAIDKKIGLMVWDRIPEEDHKFYDRLIFPNNVCGSLTMASPSGMTISGNKLFICDTDNSRILIWNNIPNENESKDPDIILNIPSYTPFFLATDGKRLAVSASFGDPSHRVLIWNTIPTINNQPPDISLGGEPEHFSIVVGIAIHDDKLFVCDQVKGRVCIYNTFPTRSDQTYDAVIGQNALNGNTSGISREKLYNTNAIYFDGEYLWVGEFKFSNRLLGFKANISPNPPLAPLITNAEAISNTQIKLNWQDNSNNERGFIINYKKTNENEYKIWKYIPISINEIKIDGLEKNTEYDINIQAYNSYGNSSSSNVITVKTKNRVNTLPNTPSNPIPIDGDRYSNHMLNLLFQIKLQWQGGDTDEGDLVKYDLCLGTRSEPNILIRQLEQNYFLDLKGGLPAEKTFYWKIISIDKEGNFNEGPIWSFETMNAGGWGQNIKIFATTGGTTFPSPGSYIYDYRGKAFITAIPNEGYKFVNWSGDIEPGQQNELTLYLVANTSKNITANFESITDINDKNDEISYDYKLYNNYPNPFNLSTLIKYSVPANNFVKITIYDILGRKVKTILEKEKMAGLHTIEWNGTNEFGAIVTSGVYFCRMNAGGKSMMTKLLLMK